MYLTKDVNSKYIKNSYSSVTKRQRIQLKDLNRHSQKEKYKWFISTWALSYIFNNHGNSNISRSRWVVSSFFQQVLKQRKSFEFWWSYVYLLIYFPTYLFWSVLFVSTIIRKNPLVDFLLLVLTTLHSAGLEVSELREEMLPPGGKTGAPLNWRWGCHLAVWISLCHWTNRQRERLLYGLEWMILIPRGKLGYCSQWGQEGLGMEPRGFPWASLSTISNSKV